MTIRALIIEDEPLGRERIRSLLDAEPDVQVVAECPDGLAAAAAVLEHAPDIVFLDVEMPGLDGFAVLDKLKGLVDRLPVVIFVTAYYKYAVRAFEVHALDYLLKPFDDDRFRQALERARAELGQQQTGDVNRRILAMLDEMKTPRGDFVDRFAVQTSDRVFFVRAEDVDWIEAASNYVRLHTGKSSHLIRGTMQSVEARLDPDRFLRIHRSAIVNIDRIRELQPWFHGEYKVILTDGTTLTLSRGYRESLQTLLGKPDTDTRTPR